jgi:hypothetical protein
MSSKYSTDNSRYVAEDIALTDHALFRWSERTPQDCDLDPCAAWTLGESVDHPMICQADAHQTPPLEVRVFNAGDWGVAFLVVRDNTQYGASKVVATVNNFRGFDHKPTVEYLRAHGPHTGGDA